MRDPTEKAFWNKLAQRWQACAAYSESEYANAQAKSRALRHQNAA